MIGYDIHLVTWSLLWIALIFQERINLLADLLHDVLGLRLAGLDFL